MSKTVRQLFTSKEAGNVLADLVASNRGLKRVAGEEVRVMYVFKNTDIVSIRIECQASEDGSPE